MSTAVSARHAVFAERTAQRRVKSLKENLEWDITKETNKVNRNPSQLQNVYKHHHNGFFDKNPQAAREGAVESLTKTFADFSLKKLSVGTFILYECNLPVKRAILYSQNRNTPKRIEERRLWSKSRPKRI
jgi:hypothetical protein